MRQIRNYGLAGKMLAFLGIVVAVSLGVLVGGCSGIMDDIYDNPPADNTFEEGFKLSSAGVSTLMLDARQYDEWIYISLDQECIERIAIPMDLDESEKWDGRSGVTYQLVHGDRFTEISLTRTAAQPAPDSWDIAIHHFDVKTNKGKVAATDFADVEQAREQWESASKEWIADTWSDNQVIVDLKEMMGYKIGYQNSYVNRELSQWATMDFSTPPPVYGASGKVYALQLPDGREYAIKLRSYMSPRGTKGFLTIDYAKLEK